MNMSRESRPPVFFDELEDLPFDPSLRIPPLQDPNPSLASRRPPTLEPNARLNAPLSSTNMKLTTRIAALAEALPIGELESDTPHTGVKKDPDEHHKGNQTEGQRKRQKLDDNGRVGDFVQLPKPSAKTKLDMPPPFRPVSILQELHEPPPSAALFPPITPSTEGEQSMYDRNYPVMGGSAGKAPKRMCLRPRMKWTDTETKDLLKGVESHGAGKWKKILNDPRLSFAQERTAVDLKDRYRTCRTTGITLEACEMAELRASEETSPHNYNELTTIPYVPSNGLSRALFTTDTPPPKQAKSHSTSAYPPFNPSYVPPIQHAISVFQSTTDLNPYRRNTTIKMADVLTPHTLNIPHPTSRARRKKRQALDGNALDNSESRKRRPKSLWTEREDEHLIQGYQKHGFQWTSIAKDAALDLSHRTGPQVRDRFRLKFPEIYMSSSAAPYPAITTADKKARPLPPPAGTTNNSLPEKNHHHNTQDKDSKRPSSQNLLHEIRQTSPSFSSEASSDSDYTDNLRSRQSSITAIAEEAKHLGILGLLNNVDDDDDDDDDDDEGVEEEEASKLPSFKYTYDDWQGDSLTLPPLLWEEMATRPIFDLE